MGTYNANVTELIDDFPRHRVISPLLVLDIPGDTTNVHHHLIVGSELSTDVLDRRLSALYVLLVNDRRTKPHLTDKVKSPHGALRTQQPLIRYQYLPYLWFLNYRPVWDNHKSPRCLTART